MIYEASLSGIIRIIFWLVLISFIIRLIARLATPYVVKKAEETMRQRAEQYRRQQQPQRREGEVTVEKTTKTAGKSVSGDYVDYVEVKD